MAVDPRKRQKKLDRRKAKQKAERRQLARTESRGMTAQMEEASAAPILHCVVSGKLWEGGLGEVLVSRLLPNGLAAFAVFLVDRSCLGVKNVIAQVAPRGRYQRDMYDRLAAPIFGQIRAEDCAEEFEFGRDGKPLFIAGPFDGPARCRHVLRTLEERCGPDGYHYILSVEVPGDEVELLE